MAKAKAPAKTTAKAAAKKAPAKTAVRKSPSKRNPAKGESYVCGLCGLAITVDEACGCVDVCGITCCGKPMKKKAARASTARK